MSYMFCENQTESIELAQKAKERVPLLLEELSHYVRSDKEITIKVSRVWHGMYWSGEAELLFGGEVVRHYEAFDLLELDLNELELSVLCRSRAARSGAAVQ